MNTHWAFWIESEIAVPLGTRDGKMVYFYTCPAVAWLLVAIAITLALTYAAWAWERWRGAGR